MCGRICTDQVCSKRVKIEIDMGEAGEDPHESTIKNWQQPTVHIFQTQYNTCTYINENIYSNSI